MTKETYLWEFQVDREENTSAQQEVGKPGAAAQILVQYDEKFVYLVQCVFLNCRVVRPVFSKSPDNTLTGNK